MTRPCNITGIIPDITQALHFIAVLLLYVTVGIVSVYFGLFLVYIY